MSAIAAARSDLMRWGACALVVVGLHAAGAAALLAWHEPVGWGDESPAIVVDLSPYVPPSESAEDLAPGQLQQQAAAPPSQEKVEPKPDEKVEPKIEAAPQEKIEVPPAPVPPVAALPPPATIEPPPPEPDAQPAPPSETPPAPVATAPPREHPASPAAINKWYRGIGEQVERHKAYAAAHARGLKGVVGLSFSLDRRGRVISSRVAQTSGDAAVDRTALATIEQAQPFPPPPADMPGEAFSFTMPLKFRVR